jgi:DNA-binding beta-propeller fold protein YncE
MVFHNPVTNRMYFAGMFSDYIQVFDVGSGEKFMSVSGWGEFYALTHCYNSNRIWLTCPVDDVLLVFDDRADTLVRVVSDAVEAPFTMAYNAVMGKLYVSVSDGRVVVLDAGSGAVLDSIELDDWVLRMAWDSLHNRVYCTGSGWENSPVVVVDCAGDSVIAEITGTRWTEDLVVHPQLPKLYCLAENHDLGTNVVRVVDTDLLAVVDSVVIPLSDPWDEFGRVFFGPGASHLYACHIEEDADGGYERGVEDTVAVIDCTTDSLVGLIELPEDYYIGGFAVNPVDEKVYLVSWYDDRVLVLGVPDSITGWIHADRWTYGAGWNPVNGMMYVVQWGDSVLVVDGATDSIVDWLDYRNLNISSLFWNPAGNKLYVGHQVGTCVVGQGDTIEKWLPVTGRPVTFSAELNRLYLNVYHHNELTVFDCNLDSVIKTVPTVTGNGLLLSELHKLYMSRDRGGNEVVIYDLYQDTVIRTASEWADRLVYNPRNGFIYGYSPGQDRLVVVDPLTDSIIRLLYFSRIADLVVNTTDNEVYHIRYSDGDEVFILDGQTHQVVDTMVLPQRAERLTWIEQGNKLYALNGDTVMVLDCVTRRYVKSIPLHVGGIHGLFLNSRNNKLWGSSSARWELFVIHCGLDSVVARFHAPADQFIWNAIDNRVYTWRYDRIYVFRDDPTGVEEMPNVEVRRPNATIVRGVLRVPETEMTNDQCPMTLLDIAGRRVMRLQPGENDVRHVSPGVYFVLWATGVEREASSVHKVVIQR